MKLKHKHGRYFFLCNIWNRRCIYIDINQWVIFNPHTINENTKKEIVQHLGEYRSPYVIPLLNINNSCFWLFWNISSVVGFIGYFPPCKLCGSFFLIPLPISGSQRVCLRGREFFSLFVPLFLFLSLPLSSLRWWGLSHNLFLFHPFSSFLCFPFVCLWICFLAWQQKNGKRGVEGTFRKNGQGNVWIDKPFQFINFDSISVALQSSWLIFSWHDLTFFVCSFQWASPFFYDVWLRLYRGGLFFQWIRILSNLNHATYCTCYFSPVMVW